MSFMTWIKPGSTAWCQKHTWFGVQLPVGISDLCRLFDSVFVSDCLCMGEQTDVDGFRGCITFFLWNDTLSRRRWDRISLRKRAKSYCFWKYLTHILKSGYISRCNLSACLSASELNCYKPDYICVCGLIKHRVRVALGLGGVAVVRS